MRRMPPSLRTSSRWTPTMSRSLPASSRCRCRLRMECCCQSCYFRTSWSTAALSRTNPASSRVRRRRTTTMPRLPQLRLHPTSLRSPFLGPVDDYLEERSKLRAPLAAGLWARHAELGKRQLVELAARRDRARELELRERGLRLLAEIAVHRTGVEAERAQPLLHAADEARVRSGSDALDRIRDRLFRMERGKGIGGDGAQRRRRHAGGEHEPRHDLQ